MCEYDARKRMQERLGKEELLKEIDKEWDNVSREFENWIQKHIPFIFKSLARRFMKPSKREKLVAELFFLNGINFYDRNLKEVVKEMMDGDDEKT